MGSINVQISNINGTEQLFDWISQIRRKKMKWLCKRHRDLRVEAVLGHALCQAEVELRSKHLERIARLQELKKKKQQEAAQADENRPDNYQNIWGSGLYPELDSFNSFMTELGGIKTPLER